MSYSFKDGIGGPCYAIANNLIALARGYRKTVKEALKLAYGKGPYSKAQYDDIIDFLDIENEIKKEISGMINPYFNETGINFISDALEGLAKNSKVMNDKPLYDEEAVDKAIDKE